MKTEELSGKDNVSKRVADVCFLFFELASLIKTNLGVDKHLGQYMDALSVHRRAEGRCRKPG